MSRFFQLLLNYAQKFLIMSTETVNERAEPDAVEPQDNDSATSVITISTLATMEQEGHQIVHVECKASDVSSIADSHSSLTSSHSSAHVSVVSSLRDVNCTPNRTTRKNSHSGGASIGSGNGGGSTVTSLDVVEFDVFRFRNNFLQAVEELKMRRDVDVKNESRIRELIEEKHQLQQKCDDIELGYAEHMEQCSRHEQEIRKQFSNQLRQFEEDRARQVCIEESRHKEIKALKDEIRALQLAKYNVEKKAEDQERQLQVQTLSRESILSEISGVESKYQTAMSQVAGTAEQMSQLAANVKQAIEMNRRLQYVNEHQKCIMAGYKAELETCRQQLVEARVSLADSLAERGERGEQIGRKTTEQDLMMHTELNKQLQVQLFGVRDEHQAVLDQLKQAHALLDKHVETAKRAQENEQKLKEEAERVKGKNGTLEADLSSLQEQLTSQTQDWSTDIKQWQDKAAEVEQRLKSLQGDYSALQNAHDQLERDGAARESELKCQIARLVEGEEQRGEEEKVGRMEMEKTVVELQKRITELEAMREAATWLNEKNGKDEEVQVAPLPAAHLDAPPPNSSSNHKLQPDPNSEDTTQNLTVQMTTRQSPTHTCMSINLPATDTEAVQNTTENHFEVPNSAECVAEGCNKETSAASSVVPSPPKSSFLSPEVISDSSSTSPSEDKLHVLSDERCHQEFKGLKLPSPRLHLERIQLPLNGTSGPSCGDGDGYVTSRSASDKWCPPVANGKNCQDAEDISPLKRKFDKQQSPVTSGKDCLPAKKPKLPAIPKDMLPAATPTTILQQPSRSEDTDITIMAITQSQPTEISPDIHSFQSLSQPSYSSRVVEADSKSRSHSSDPQPRKGSVPWRIDLPESFYSMTRRKLTSDKDPIALPQCKLPWNITMPQPRNTSPSETNTTSSTVNKSLDQHNTPPVSANTNFMITRNTHSLSPTTTHSSPNTPHSRVMKHDDSHLETCKTLAYAADQSVPNSPGGSGNFAIVFSEGEEEGEEGGGKDGLLSSQMNRQIKKVKTFLKMDRLRRTKVPKV